MSHRKASKTDFSDDFRGLASCRDVVTLDPSLATAWDNVDEGTWEEDRFVSDPQEFTAKNICASCPVSYLCLKDALSDNEAEGIRAGYRFEQGYVTKEDSRKMYKEHGLRGKIRKAPNVVYLDDIES